MRPSCALAVAAIALAAPTEPQETVVEAGPLRLEVHVSRTAHLFHVVDQISAWSPFCHTQYLAWFPDGSAEDRELLAAHREVRSRRGWGSGLEQTFYTPATLEQAVERGLEEGWLDARDADTELAVLEHFAGRVDRLLEAERARLLAFRARIEREAPRLEAFSRRLAELVGGAPPDGVPVYLLANPSAHDFGGGYNGGRLTIEVPARADAFGTFLHEVFHAFLDRRRDEVARRVEGVDERLDYQTLNEGLAHAISPGIHHAQGEGADPLAQRVKRFEREGMGLDDYPLRVHAYALALRPLVRDAIADEGVSFETLLDRAIEVWIEFASERAPADARAGASER